VSKTPPPDVAPPDLPGYRYLQHLGVGGNAQVYLYEQNLPRRRVAVKVLKESALSEAARRRFTAEANVTADLAHRHIVQVFDANVTPDGRPYIVMPYYPQPNLSVRARRSHFSVADVLRIGIQIGSAVETSHRRGVLHRDIKPQNILTDSYGEPALTDFGIATTQGSDGPEGLSVPWSPPEILFGTSPGDRRADVYSLGATLWHLLVGRSPFEQPGGDNGTFTLMGRINSEPPPRTQRADVPEGLERLLRQALAKDPAARPQSAMELIRGLQSIEQELRLPLTHPILPADESPADIGGGDTIARPWSRGGNPFAGGAASHPQSGPASHPQSGQASHPQSGPASNTQSGQASYPQSGSTSHTESGPTGHTQSGQQPPWGQTIPPWDAAVDHRTQGAPAAWSGGGYEQASRPARAEEDPTRRRAPMRVDPWGPGDNDSTRARGPVRLDPRGAPGPGTGAPAPDAGAGFPDFFPGGREAFPAAGTAEPSDPAVTGRGVAGRGATRKGASGKGATGKGGWPSGRVLVLSGGVLVAAVAVGAFFTLGHGTGQAQSPPAVSQSAAPGGEQNALGPGATAPGSPTVTAHRADATQVRFSWTYANPAAGDTFRWQRVSGSAGTKGGTTAKPRLLLSLPAGRSVCIVVQVRRAGGQASDPSPPACWPNLLVDHNT